MGLGATTVIGLESAFHIKILSAFLDGKGEFVILQLIKHIFN